jgi:transcriptional regulator NrdR family protein
MDPEKLANCGACGQNFSSYEDLNTHKVTVHNQTAQEFTEKKKLEEQAFKKAAAEAGVSEAEIRKTFSKK